MGRGRKRTGRRRRCHRNESRHTHGKTWDGWRYKQEGGRGGGCQQWGGGEGGKGAGISCLHAGPLGALGFRKVHEVHGFHGLGLCLLRNHDEQDRVRSG